MGLALVTVCLLNFALLVELHCRRGLSFNLRIEILIGRDKEVISTSERPWSSFETYSPSFLYSYYFVCPHKCCSGKCEGAWSVTHIDRSRERNGGPNNCGCEQWDPALCVVLAVLARCTRAVGCALCEPGWNMSKGTALRPLRHYFAAQKSSWMIVPRTADHYHLCEEEGGLS